MKPSRSTHTGIFASRPSQVYCVPDAHGYCATCADEALPAAIQQLLPDECTATVEINGQLSEIDISLIEGAAVGQVVLVHGGVAIGMADAEDER